ncbi:hypothetical protein C8J56DRAFT_1165901 [Mycena floridula]|nr:hypothetical protein C8J56DRAFT_1165901 [Mycena floridula]
MPSGPIRNHGKGNRTTTASSKYRTGGSTGRLGRLAGFKTLTRTHVMAAKVQEGFHVQHPHSSNDESILKQHHDEGEDGDGDTWMEPAILEGRMALPISHEGGEWDDINDLWSKDISGAQNTSRQDPASRVLQFASQMQSLVNVYMSWSAKEESAEEIKAHHAVKVVDTFNSYTGSVTEVSSDKYLATAMVRQGLFPCSAVKIKVAISTATLELFRSLFVRCPRLTIQPFVKTLCDLHGIPFRRYLAMQFSIAYDLYLDVLHLVRKRVAVSLGRDDANWRLANACPCCLYELDDEPQLQYSMFFTMDGNDSLKRMHRHERVIDELGDRLGRTKERIDVREGGGDYFLPRKEVDGWDIHLDPEKPVEEGPQGCDQWHNSKESNTRPMWQIYDETGIFLSLCRHGFVLLIADMVQSGELMKYAIATLNRFFRILPSGMGGGYDIGSFCWFPPLVVSAVCKLLFAAGFSFTDRSFFHHYLGMNINRARRKVQPPLLVYLHLQSPPSQFLSSNAPNECPKLQCYHCYSSLATTIYP